MNQTRTVSGLLDAVLIALLFLLVHRQMREYGFHDWQEPIFGQPLVSSVILFFILPMLLAGLRTINPGKIGLSAHDWKDQRRTAIRGLAFTLPATMIFPIIGLLGLDMMDWSGALMLTLGFGLGGYFFIMKSGDLPGHTMVEVKTGKTLLFVGILLAGLVLSALLHQVFPLGARIIRVLLFVGFLEEFFFRGYLQSRLNDYFGRPFTIASVQFGPGLILAAVAFGLFHPMTMTSNPAWPWALWTCVMGLTFGFAREKTGSAIAPSIMHGILVLPTAFFVPG